VDGEKFDNDTQINQTDLEDGDMVEVVGIVTEYMASIFFSEGFFMRIPE
jgi:hypothetical protein